MGERILRHLDQLGETLLEWRDPTGGSVEWVVEHNEGTEILFRWSGAPGSDSFLFPATQYCSAFSWSETKTWRFDLGDLEKAIHRLRRDWGPDIIGLWFSESRHWFPTQEWSEASWRRDVGVVILPWLSETDLSVIELTDELRPLLQSSTVQAGIGALGFPNVGKKLTSLVIKELVLELRIARQGHLAMKATVWASRCREYLKVDDLYSFWRVPGSDMETFLINLSLWQTSTAEKLKKAVREHPVFDGWKSSLAHFAGAKDPREVEWRELDETEQLASERLDWPEEIVEQYTGSWGDWSTRLPLDHDEIRGWGHRLKNCLRKANPTTFRPEWTVLVGLFHQGKLVALSEWGHDGRLRQWKGKMNRMITPEERAAFLRLLPLPKGGPVELEVFV